jgi:hypothetical protein
MVSVSTILSYASTFLYPLPLAKNKIKNPNFLQKFPMTQEWDKKKSELNKTLFWTNEQRIGERGQAEESRV